MVWVKDWLWLLFSIMLFEKIYHHWRFVFVIFVADGYPFEPPKMKFTTKVWYGYVVSVLYLVGLLNIVVKFYMSMTVEYVIGSVKCAIQWIGGLLKSAAAPYGFSLMMLIYWDLCVSLISTVVYCLFIFLVEMFLLNHKNATLFTIFKILVCQHFL